MKQYSLKEILDIVNQKFSEFFESFDFWFMAEISRFSSSKWHVYLDLVQFDENHNIIAKARWIIWEISLWQKFLNEIWLTQNELKWIKLLMHWKVNFHCDYWFSIIIDDLSSEYIIWQLQKKKTDIIQELIKLWILNKNKNTNLWFPPYRIAVISSKTSQWLNDFETILNQSQLNFFVDKYFASIHWNQAKKEVLFQLRAIFKEITKKWKVYSAVVIIRWWGGSSWILWQDDLNIAKWICHMPVPVIIAVWHTKDQYILDQIAYFSAKTPTDAWYFFVNKTKEYLDNVEIFYKNINNFCSKKMSDLAFLLKNLYERIEQQIKLKLHYLNERIEYYYSNITSIDPQKLNKYWYATLHNLKWKFLTKKKIEKLKEWDEIIIKVYDKQLKVKILNQK